MEISNFPSMLTPPILFLLLNFVILTIALISFLHHKPHPPPPSAAANAAADSPPLVRASSSNVLECFRSGLFRFRSGELSLPPATESAVDHEISADPTTHQTYKRAQSESESESSQERSLMEKTVSEKCPAQGRHIRRQVSVDVEVDAKADDFINRFRKQLKLQRLDSLFKHKDAITHKRD